MIDPSSPPVLFLGGTSGIISIVVFIIIIVSVWKSIRLVQAYEKKALTRFGQYQGLLEPGINFVYPYVSKTYSFDMRTQTIDVPRQEAITRDNSPVTCDAVVYMKVMDAKKAFLEVENHTRAVSNLAQTTLRSVIGDMELDDTLNKRAEINAQIRKELDESTDAWGIRVESVEVREVSPSKDVQDAMEKQTSAERRRRAMILEAQGERRSAIEKARGKKESSIIEAEGEKKSEIIQAQGEAISTVLEAKASESMGERAIIERSLETLEGIGEGESTKYIIPQELSSLLGRYGKHLSGGDVKAGKEVLDSLDLDDDTRELLDLDDIKELLETEDDVVDDEELEKMEEEAEQIKEGNVDAVEADQLKKDDIAEREGTEDTGQN
ncbi:MAG: SPFH domain-containing protein [Halobacteria archaeon]